MRKGWSKLLTALVIVVALSLLAKELLDSYRSPPPPLDTRLGERLALAGEYSGPLPFGLEEHLRALALSVENDSANRAVILGREPSNAEALSSGYRLWYQYQQERRDYQLHELRRLGYSSLRRLLLVGGGLALALCILPAGWLPPPPDPKSETPPLPGPKLFLCFGILGAWFAGNSLIVGLARAYLTPYFPRFWLTISVQGAAYLLGLALLAHFWTWGDWRPWKGIDWRWVSGGYLAILILLPLSEVLISSVTGIHPAVHLSLLPYFQGLTSLQGVSLCVFAVLIGPLFEELLFRGWLLGGLRTRMGKTPSILIAALIFALVHLNLWGWPVSFVFGVVTGGITLRTNSVATAVVIHSLWNATTLGWVYLNIP